MLKTTSKCILGLLRVLQWYAVSRMINEQTHNNCICASTVDTSIIVGRYIHYDGKTISWYSHFSSWILAPVTFGLEAIIILVYFSVPVAHPIAYTFSSSVVLLLLLWHIIVQLRSKRFQRNTHRRRRRRRSTTNGSILY